MDSPTEYLASLSSDQNVSFRPVYLLIRPGLVIVHHTDPRPIDTNQIPYLLISIFPTSNGSRIQNITGVYVYGTNSGDYVETQINDLRLDRLVIGTGSCLIDKLKHCYLSLSGRAQSEILHPTEPELNGVYHHSHHVTTQSVSDQAVVYPRQPNLNPAASQLPLGTLTHHRAELSFPGSTDFESFMTAFMVGIGAHLTIFDILRHDQFKISDPFHPFVIKYPPTTDQPEDLLTQGVGEYLGYFARTLQSISRGEKHISRIGSTWLSLIDHFWRGYASCFESGSCDSLVAIHETVIGYCRHQDSKVQELESRFREISVATNNHLSDIQIQGQTILDQIETTSKASQDDLTKIADQTLALMTKAAQDFETKISSLTETSISSIQEERQSTIGSITTLRSDTQKSINQWTDQGVEQIQTVYSQGYEELSSTKTNGLAEIQNETNKSLGQIYAGHDRVSAELVNTRKGVANDLAELHNQAIEKGFKVMEERKRHFFQFNSVILDNIQQIVDDHLTVMENMKDQICKSNQLALAEVDVRVKQAKQKVDGMTAIGLTKLLDQQDHIATGVREDAKKTSRQELKEAMNQAIQDALRKLNLGIDQIISNSLQEQINSHLNRLNQELSRAVTTANQVELTSVGTRTAASEIKTLLAISKAQQEQLEHRMDKMNKSDTSHLEAKVDRLESDLSQALQLIRQLIGPGQIDMIQLSNRDIFPVQPDKVESPIIQLIKNDRLESPFLQLISSQEKVLT